MFAKRSILGRLALMLALALFLVAPTGAADDPLPEVFSKPAPESPEDLRMIQEHVRGILDKVLPATVGVSVGSSQGSGVIISEDGYILTAGHVAGEPDQRVNITLQDGTRLTGETLGINENIDSGLIKITSSGTWSYVEMGVSDELDKGDWVIAAGHPGGYRSGRSPVVRLGRVVSTRSSVIRTDCALVGGDSGGPLFDMHGRVVGIHSRIGGSITANHHVPVDTYRDTWDRLVAGEAWGGAFGFGGDDRASDEPYYGIQFDDDKNASPGRIKDVIAGGPADEGGLKAGDVVLKFEGREFTDLDNLRTLLRKQEPGDKVAFMVRREDAVLTIRIVVGNRPG